MGQKLLWDSVTDVQVVANASLKFFTRLFAYFVTLSNCESPYFFMMQMLLSKLPVGTILDAAYVPTFVEPILHYAKGLSKIAKSMLNFSF